ncbi:hypothetical protein JZ751_026035 [Albula glossodonta]|uniref:Uncharacterized protein n=1 Tax=Albula glossodonta TaxID=121402 RepID=A0A8T2N0W2_9TELE|nr:hypothetical protein JZ751_026035 [Albula glossodonta]
MSAKDVSGETGYLCHRFKMEECMSPAEVKGKKKKEDNLSTHSELSASNDSLSDNNNTKEKGGILSGRFRLAPKPAEHSLPAQEKGGMFTGKFRKTPKPSGGPTPAQDNLFTHSELSASNDSLSDNNTKINREVTQSECREDQSEPEHRQVCAKSDKGVFGGIFWKIPKERAATFTISRVSSTDSHSVELPQIHTSTDTCLEPPENKQEKGGKFTGLFRKSPKPAEDTASVQEIASIHGELSASNDSLSDIDTKKKGAKFTGLFRKSPKPAEDTAPVQEIESIHGELSASNDSLSDIDTKKKGGKFTGLFRKSPKPAEDTAPVQVAILTLYSPLPAQEIASIHGELSASNDSLSDIDTKSDFCITLSIQIHPGPIIIQKKGGKFTGLFRKSPKPAEDTAPVQEIESIHGELSASNDSLSDIDTKKKGGKFTGLFRKSPKPAEDTAPVQVTI